MRCDFLRSSVDAAVEINRVKPVISKYCPEFCFQKPLELVAIEPVY